MEDYEHLKYQIFTVIKTRKKDYKVKIGDFYEFVKFNSKLHKKGRSILIKRVNGENYETFGVHCCDLTYVYDDDLQVDFVSPAIKILFDIENQPC